MTTEVQESVVNTTRKSFATLQELYQWANCQVNRGLCVTGSRLYCDLFPNARPRGLTGRYVKMLGISPKAEKKFKDIEPNGQWHLEIDPPGTSFETYGIWGNKTHQTTGYRFSVWYSRFLPYAVAMMECENGFEVFGADYQFINVYYTTVLGFVELGFGNGQRIDAADEKSFSAIYHASMACLSPSLPFDESFNPCCCYVALTNPTLFEKLTDSGHWVRNHVHDVCEALGRYCPIKRSVS